MTLVALAISVSFGYSIAVTLGLQGDSFYMELATLVDVMLLGHWLEMASVQGASRALEHLADLVPSIAHKQVNGRVEDVAVSALVDEKLAAAKPRAVTLDLVLTESDPDPEQDRLLAAAMRRAAPLVLPLLDTLPAPALRDAALLGMAEPTVDADGVLRHAFLRAGPTGATANCFPPVLIIA